MVERSLSMREARGSIPRFSRSFCSSGSVQRAQRIFVVSSIQVFCETRWLALLYNSKEITNWQRSGAVGACRAHNPEVVGSKPTFATWSWWCGVSSLLEYQSNIPRTSLLLESLVVLLFWTSFFWMIVSRSRPKTSGSSASSRARSGSLIV